MKTKDFAKQHDLSEFDLKRLMIEKFGGANPTTITPEQAEAIAPAIQELKDRQRSSDTPALPSPPAPDADGTRETPLIEEPPAATKKKRGGKIATAQQSTLKAQVGTDIRKEQVEQVAVNASNAESTFIEVSNQAAAQMGANDATRLFAVRVATSKAVYSSLMNNYTAALVDQVANHAAATSGLDLTKYVSQFVEGDEAQKNGQQDVLETLNELNQQAKDYHSVIQNSSFF